MAGGENVTNWLSGILLLYVGDCCVGDRGRVGSGSGSPSSTHLWQSVSFCFTLQEASADRQDQKQVVPCPGSPVGASAVRTLILAMC